MAEVSERSCDVTVTQKQWNSFKNILTSIDYKEPTSKLTRTPYKPEKLTKFFNFMEERREVASLLKLCETSKENTL